MIAMVATISHAAGIWIGMRSAIMVGVRNGMNVRIFSHIAPGSFIAGIARMIGTMRRMTRYDVTCCASCSVVRGDPTPIKIAA